MRRLFTPRERRRRRRRGEFAKGALGRGEEEEEEEIQEIYSREVAAHDSRGYGKPKLDPRAINFLSTPQAR